MVNCQIKKEIKATLQKLTQKLEKNTQRGGRPGGAIHSYGPGQWVVIGQGGLRNACFTQQNVVSGTLAENAYVTYDSTDNHCPANGNWRQAINVVVE